MRTFAYFFVVVILSTVFLKCRETTSNEKFNSLLLNEDYQTERNEKDNIDSPAFWKMNNEVGWLISTAKSTDKIVVHDAATGKFIRTFGKRGDKKGEFKRPNGISVIDSLLFIVERDNQRVQILSLPSFNHVAFIGNTELIKPYGIFVNKISDDYYNIYITDNYETPDELIPPDSMLNKRVQIYKFIISESDTTSELIKKFGDTEGKGKLKVVESIYGDPSHNNLLIAEELEYETCVKVYDLNGKFKNVTIGDEIFEFQAEGIALYRSDQQNGLWIITDQDSLENKFHVFDRISFNHLGFFRLSKTVNTDGIWLTQTAFKNFGKGAFFAVNNDGNTSCIRLELIIDAFKN